MINVGIVGATGYSARELISILLRHPDVSLNRVTSRDPQSTKLAVSHPELLGRCELDLTPFAVDDFIAAGIQCVFSCLPHAASAEIARQLLEHDIRVIDFSADYRLNDVSTFEKWYGVQHPDPSRVGHTPYGLPELFRNEIGNSPLVANPGCYPTSAILPLAALVKRDLIELDDIIIDAKSGITGAGRSTKPHLHFPEANESTMAYSIGQHRHQPEVEHIIYRYTSRQVKIVFTPHLVPMNRGILSTIYVRPKPGVNPAAIESALLEHYDSEPFVRIRKTTPSTKAVTHLNFCDLHVAPNGQRAVIVSAIDNLYKGAAGAAVQNFNLMFGLSESLALN